ncbi:MAG TPA: DUF423 domain-containing protein [Sphingomonadaceae bacterium]|nr:DUF423 domain-containing protein [Sphingomonadaceae bacterium]
MIEAGSLAGQTRPILLAGALLAATGVAMGAFGANALRDTLGPDKLATWNTAVQYQMWHAVALAALSAVAIPRLGLPSALLVAGTILFSGSLYALALTGARWLGPVTPLGGMLMIAGWAVLAWRALR